MDPSSYSSLPLALDTRPYTTGKRTGSKAAFEVGLLRGLAYRKCRSRDNSFVLHLIAVPPLETVRPSLLIGRMLSLSCSGLSLSRTRAVPFRFMRKADLG